MAEFFEHDNGAALSAASTLSALVTVSAAPPPDDDDPPGGVDTVLGHLGFAPAERVAVCWLEGGRFRSQVVPVAEAPLLVALHADGDCWVSTQPLREGIEPGKRGSEADVIGVRALRADLDVKLGGLSDIEAAYMVVTELAELLGEQPVVTVRSGHGLQPGWRIVGEGTSWTSPASPQARRARRLVRGWGRLVAAVCEGWGSKTDPVFDLSRVMRVSGTVNCKEPDARVPVTADVRVDEDEFSITFDRLEAVLLREGITLGDDESEVLGVQQSSPAGWGWAEHTCGYARGWATEVVRDKPVERHPWLLGQAVRLACAHRLGCLTEADYAALQATIVARFRTRLNVGKKRSESRGEVAAAIAWGVAKAATFTDDRARSELGGHVHPGEEKPVEHPPTNLAEVHAIYQRELGEAVDLQAVDATLAVAASGQLSGDPTWLLVVGGSGVGKTETLSPLTAAGAVMASSISSEGALLSGTSAKERAADAHGGLLRRIGPRGLLVLKDVTTILSMQRDARAAVLAALREVYDGRWDRHLGSDGGQTLTWQGHCTVIGGVTTAWDAAHGVVSAMGDRFILVRPRIDEEAAGRAALAASGREAEMRAALAGAAGGLLQHLDVSVLEGAAPPIERILALATVVTWTRTAVERDYRGDVIDVHAREAPTRFAKQLLQLWRGARVIGLDDAAATALVERVAADSMPPSRAAVLSALHHMRGASAATTDIARAVQRPRTTVDQTLQALVALRLARVIEVPGGAWQWALATGAGAPDADVVAALVPGNVGTSTPSAQSALSAPTESPF